jgi:S1-C subfamily serine protease
MGMVNQLFPQGMTKVTLADFKTPPADGAQLTSTSPASAAAGLHSGDVIVAIDGYLVHNDQQYQYVRGLTADPKLQLIVWNAQGYREIAASAPERRFNVGLKTYKHGSQVSTK